MVNSVAKAGSPEKVTFNTKRGGDEEPPGGSGQKALWAERAANAEAAGEVRMWGVRSQCGWDGRGGAQTAQPLAPRGRS